MSRGHRSPEGFWYDQAEDELVVLVAGEATLRIAGEAADRRLRAGEWLLLPAGLRHRVTWTPTDRDTVWLAVFMAPPPADA